MNPRRTHSASLTRAFHSSFQHTLKAAVTCEGIGLHNGERVRLTLCPAPANTGILFSRTDLGGKIIPAHWERLKDEQLCTAIANDDGVTVSTVEHLMAALWGSGVDNAIVEIDGSEVPAMDGSSEPFLRAIAQAGVTQQTAPRRTIEILKPVEARDSRGGTVRLEPADAFRLDVTIDFPGTLIGRQRGEYDFSRQSLSDTLGDARTFGFERDVPVMKAHGKGLGGSYENAVVVGEKKVKNPEGLRSEDEFVRHKALDCIGDLFMAGGRLKAKVIAERPGHALNKAVLEALFAQPDAYRWVEAEPEKKAPRALGGNGALAQHSPVTAQAGYLK